MQNRSLDCSIVTVALPHHAEFLFQNAKTLKKLGVDAWIVVGCDENTNERIQKIDSKFICVRGAVYEPRYSEVAAGVQHSKSLKLGLEVVKTKNVLILDPDFLILNASQLELLIVDFNLSGKKIIGTPYFPIWYSKRMDAVAIYLAITTKDFLINEINFYPKNILDLYNESHNLGSKRKPKKFFWANLKMFKRFNFINLVFILFFRRFKINSEFDICADTENYYNYSSEFLKIEITTKQLAKISPHLRYEMGRKLERIINRRFSYLPNSYNILDTSFFLEEQVEHYSYKNILIGGHFRIFGNQNMHQKDFYTREILENYLDSISSFRF
jgi:hypothetical protein